MVGRDEAIRVAAAEPFKPEPLASCRSRRQTSRVGRECAMAMGKTGVREEIARFLAQRWWGAWPIWAAVRFVDASPFCSIAPDSTRFGRRSDGWLPTSKHLVSSYR